MAAGRGKGVFIDGWQNLNVSSDVMEWLATDQYADEWPSWRNTGIQMGRVVIAADNDITDADLSAKVQTIIDNHLGTSPCIRIGSKGQAALYRVEAPMRSVVIRGLRPMAKIERRP